MIDLFYVALSLAFAAVITYMIVHNLRHKTPKAIQQQRARPRATDDEKLQGRP